MPELRDHMEQKGATATLRSLDKTPQEFKTKTFWFTFWIENRTPSLQ